MNQRHSGILSTIHVKNNEDGHLQTYLGLRENLAANEGVRSLLYDSQRDR